MTCKPPPPLELPGDLSDEAAAQLIECLYAFARYLENRYFDQLHRYYHADDPRQRALWNDDETMF
ncbi:MAG: hypothetical protein ACE5LB_16935 [Acidiferrobacterales bacterium]